MSASHVIKEDCPGVAYHGKVVEEKNLGQCELAMLFNKMAGHPN